MPFKARRPAGGFRVMYEYANRLSELGYVVTITYPIETKFMKYRFPFVVRLLLSYIEGFRTNEWFIFNKNIKRKYVPRVENKYLDDSDIVIATWWATAFDMGKLASSKGKKINLIQGYENWEGHEELLHQSYDMEGVTNVVVASYLSKIVKQYTNNRIDLISNAIDSNTFHVRIPILERDPLRICMLYSVQAIKGSKYGLEALQLVKQKYPDLQVDLFGICPQPESLPDWMLFHRNPSDLCGVYNRNSIFISNSLTEGFGLVSVEALACGCALICTDIPGHREYAKDRYTALLVEPQNSKQLASKICELIEDKALRLQIVENGLEAVRQFSWGTAVSRMDLLIKELLSEEK